MFPGLAKLSTQAENLGQNVRGQSVLAKLSVAKVSYIHICHRKPNVPYVLCLIL